MIIRKLTPKHFEWLNSALVKGAQAEPLEACYTVTMKVNGAEYVLKVQPERHNKMAALQALRLLRDEDNINFELITRPPLLSALLELLIEQGLSPA